MSNKYDVVILGGGIVGLSIAKQLLEKSASLSIAIVDKESSLAQHNSGRNSGVLHAGIYYKPGTLKAKVCVKGARRLKKWILENKEITSEVTKITKTNYKATSRTDLVKDKKQIDENIIQNKFSVIDARSKDRFEGKVSEPRPGLRSGSIPNSQCIPFNQVLNEDKTFKNKFDLEQLFNSNLNDLKNNNVVFSCGSGVTACVLAFAYYLISDTYEPKIYDGSWAEYGKI